MVIASEHPTVSLEEFLASPGDRVEWVNGVLTEKSEMTAQTGRIQARLARFWGNFKDDQGYGGEVYTETSCRTVGRVRCPDVAYLNPEQVEEFGNFKVLPHSFPLIAEIISPTDEAEEVFTKVREYLDSQAQEVWLIFPESRWVMIVTAQSQQLLNDQQSATSQIVLPGFTVVVSELIA
jgi:Uma2 family endonuclease